MKPIKYDFKEVDYFLVDNNSWEPLAKALIAEGYQWSGHSPIETDVNGNYGASKLINSPTGCSIWLYDKENKLICVQPAYLHEDEKPQQFSFFNRK